MANSRYRPMRSRRTRTDEMPAFVRVVSVQSARANKATRERRSATIEIVIGAIKVRIDTALDALDRR
jgi:hypothetical protein